MNFNKLILLCIATLMAKETTSNPNTNTNTNTNNEKNVPSTNQKQKNVTDKTEEENSAKGIFAFAALACAFITTLAL